MSYTIQQVSKMTRIPATTLRYYDKEGLLPFLERTESGYRRFSDVDLASLQIVQCLKSARLSIEEIRQFSEWVHEGDSTLQKRLDLFLRRKEEMEKQIEEWKKILDVINYKCEYYQKAVEAGTEKHLFAKDKLPHADEFITAMPSLQILRHLKIESIKKSPFGI